MGKSERSRDARSLGEEPPSLTAKWPMKALFQIRKKSYGPES